MSIFDQIRDAGIELDPFKETILSASGVRTTEDLFSLLAAFPSLAQQYGIPSATITGKLGGRLSPAFSVALRKARPTSPAFGAVPPPGTVHGVGTIAGIAPRPSTQVTAGTVTTGPTTIDNRPPHWPVRDQGARGTCVAFGATACVEQNGATPGMSPSDLSEQFLYYQIKTASLDPQPTQDGTWLEFARDMLSAHGICEESLARYAGPGKISPVSGAAPSANAVADASTRVTAITTYLSTPGGPARTILSLLQNGHPVAASFPVFEDTTTHDTNWSTQVAWLYGRVFDPPPHSVAAGGHCVCITGFVPDAAEPTGGYFIFRNSWGSAWSSNSPSLGHSYAPEAGYGEISATYVDNFCWELLQV